MRVVPLIDRIEIGVLSPPRVSGWGDYKVLPFSHLSLFLGKFCLLLPVHPLLLSIHPAMQSSLGNILASVGVSLAKGESKDL